MILSHSPQLSRNSLEIHNDGAFLHLYPLQQSKSGEVQIAGTKVGGDATIREPARWESPFTFVIRIALNGDDDVVFEVESIGPADESDATKTRPRTKNDVELTKDLKYLANAIVLAAELSHPSPPTDILVRKILLGEKASNTNRYAKLRGQLRISYGRYGLPDLKREAESRGDVDQAIIGELRNRIGI